MTVPLAVVRLPLLLGTAVRDTLPAEMVIDVSVPYGTSAPYLPTPYGDAETGVSDKENTAMNISVIFTKKLFTLFMLVLL